MCYTGCPRKGEIRKLGPKSKKKFKVLEIAQIREKSNNIFYLDPNFLIPPFSGTPCSYSYISQFYLRIKVNNMVTVNRTVKNINRKIKFTPKNVRVYSKRSSDKCKEGCQNEHCFEFY